MNDRALYERLIAKTRADADSGCWLWTGPYHSKRKYAANRYGFISIWNSERGVSASINTHRAMWIAVHGTPTKGICVCHRCDTPLCINPEHMFLGSHKDNMADSRRKGRHFLSAKTHCKRGHELTKENIRYHGKQRLRQCKICERARLRIGYGWPADLAYSLPVTPLGYRPVNATRPPKARSNASEGRT